ncbi:hypothetical protein ABBQ32_003483 [Trebouxia sp. C0010 RCD-2024]
MSQGIFWKRDGTRAGVREQPEGEQLEGGTADNSATGYGGLDAPAESVPTADGSKGASSDDSSEDDSG